MNPLDSIQLENLRERLTQRESELRAQIDAARGTVEAVADAATGHEVGDRKDEAAARQLSGVAVAELDRDLAEIVAVQAAKRRMADGVYGVCIDCDDAIGWQRLQVQPEAVRCAACQRRHEQGRARSTRR
jgi:RNA polymerase-binding transcription factor DksA